MSTSIVLCHNYFILFNHYSSSNFMLEEGGLSLSLGGSSSSSTISISTTRRSSSRRHLNKHFISNAEKHSGSSSSSSSSWSWWHKFFFEDDGNWLGLKEDDMVEAEVESESQEEEEDDKFEAWKQRAEAIIELREAQQDRSNQEFRRWEDWLLLDDNKEWEWEEQQQQQPQPQPQPSDYYIRDRDQEKGVVESIRSFLFATQQDDDMLYEDRVFQYASSNSAKFLAVLIIIPWAMDFLVHDYILMPFLDRYVKTVPLAAQMLDVRRYQKLEIVEELRTERGRFELEVEIGKSPPLSDDEIWWELRHKALELRDEWRLENRRAFANIWSDTVYGISLFILLYFNKSQVALLKFTGYKIINNISDTGKAFLIILITDIFLGYHSESGWQTLLEIIVDHYGLDIDHSAITVFICLVPVIIDACVKLWAFTDAYSELASTLCGLNVLIETYFAYIPAEAYKTLTSLSGVTAYGFDLVRGTKTLDLIKGGFPSGKYLFAGVVDGRNIWANDLAASISTLEALEGIVGKDKLVVSTSCSLLHTAVDLVNETKLDDEIKSWLAFAAQKVVEVNACIG